MPTQLLALAAEGKLDANSLGVLWGVVKQLLGLETITTLEEFKAKVLGFLSVGELLAGFTATKVDDNLVAQAKAWFANDLVVSVIWSIYQKLLASPATAHEMTPERFGALVQETVVEHQKAA